MTVFVAFTSAGEATRVFGSTLRNGQGITGVSVETSLRFLSTTCIVIEVGIQFSARWWRCLEAGAARALQGVRAGACPRR